MNAAKQIIKIIISYCLYYSGIIAIICKLKLRNKLVVLMYHRILSDSEKTNSFSNTGIIVSKLTFNKHMQHIVNYFSPLHINQVLDQIKNNTPFQGGDCLITFDDGWHDNYENALPILEKYGLSALIFLPTNYISTNDLFWQERLSGAIDFISTHGQFTSGLLKKYGLENILKLQTDKRRKAISNFIGSLKKLSNQDIDQLLIEFSQRLEKEDTSISLPSTNIDKYISWDQAKTMSKSVVDFGSHAMSHRLLTKLEKPELENEIKLSKAIIEEKLSQSVRSIAYPNGNYNAHVLNSVLQNNYEIAFKTRNGYFQIGDNPYEVKRINMHQNATANIPLLMCRILGIF